MKIEKVTLLKIASNDIIYGSHPRNKIPPLELKYIEALLKKEKIFDVRLLDQFTYMYSDSEIIDIINKDNVQIVLISFTTLERKKVDNLIKVCKKNRILFFGIGQGVGAYSNWYVDWLMDCFDILIPGEPEAVFMSCIKKILKGWNVGELQKKIWDEYLMNGPYIVENLDALPILDYRLSEINVYRSLYPLKKAKRFKWGYISSSRGCPHSCIFCSPIMRRSYGHKVRYRRLDDVMSEIEGLVKIGVGIISFEDDNFTHSPNHLKSICREIIKRNLKISWIAHARVDEISSDLLEIMKKSGCVLLRFGIESASERIVSYIKKADGEIWQKRAEEVFSWLRKARIDINAMFMIGNPMETKKDIEKTIAFAKKLKPDSIQVALFEVYPGSSLFVSLNQEEKDKILRSSSYHYKDVAFNVSRVKREELVYFHRKFYINFVLDLRYITRHLLKYFLYYLLNITIFIKLIRGLIKKGVCENFSSQIS